MMFHPAFHPHDATFGASPYDAFYSPQRPFVRSDYARAQREAALREADRRASVRAQHELAARQQELARRQAQAKQRTGDALFIDRRRTPPRYQEAAASTPFRNRQS